MRIHLNYRERRKSSIGLHTAIDENKYRFSDAIDKSIRSDSVSRNSLKLFYMIFHCSLHSRILRCVFLRYSCSFITHSVKWMHNRTLNCRICVRNVLAFNLRHDSHCVHVCCCCFFWKSCTKCVKSCSRITKLQLNVSSYVSFCLHFCVGWNILKATALCVRLFVFDFVFISDSTAWLPHH